MYADIIIEENLGYKTSADTKIPVKQNHLFLCTTEILNMDIRKSIFVSREKIAYRCIIVDEVHEQSIEMLNLLNNLKYY